MPVGEDHIFPHDGVERTYKMYKPDNGTWCADGLCPACMTSNSTWSYLTGFNDLAEEHGFLAVYPQSYPVDHVRWVVSKTTLARMTLPTFCDKAKNCKEGETFTAMGMEILCQNGLLTTQQLRWNNENADHLFDGQSDVSFLTALAKSLQDEFDLSREKPSCRISQRRLHELYADVSGERCLYGRWCRGWIDRCRGPEEMFARPAQTGYSYSRR